VNPYLEHIATYAERVKHLLSTEVEEADPWGPSPPDDYGLGGL